MPEVTHATGILQAPRSEERVGWLGLSGQRVQGQLYFAFALVTVSDSSFCSCGPISNFPHSEQRKVQHAEQVGIEHWQEGKFLEGIIKTPNSGPEGQPLKTFIASAEPLQGFMLRIFSSKTQYSCVPSRDDSGHMWAPSLESSLDPAGIAGF